MTEEIPDFLTFWELYQSTRSQQHSRIDLALRRFNFGYERIRPEDKLIDYSIGFETLLSKGKEELRYRISLMGAALLGKDPNLRKKIFNELQAMYDQRSDIVHGEKLKDHVKIKGGERVPFHAFVERVEDHLRLTLKELIERCEKQSEDQVRQSLEEKIIGGS